MECNMAVLCLATEQQKMASCKAKEMTLIKREALVRARKYKF